MYLRVTAFKSDPAKLDEGIAFMKDKIIPTLTQLPGCLGATCIVDREKGSGVASTLWESLEAMNKAEDAGNQARIRSTEATGIEVVDVDRFEITVREIAQPNAPLPSYTRVITAYGDPAKTEKTAQMLRESIPQIKARPGFRAFVAGVNRATGRGFTSSSWDSPEHREDSDKMLAASRPPVIEAGGLYGLEIANVETVIAEIKLPVTP